MRVLMLKRKSQQLTYTKENGASVTAVGGGFHCCQTHDPKSNHAILISANMTPIKNRFVFRVHGVETCRAFARSRRFLHMS